MTVAERIRIARKNAGLSQKELGDKLNMSPVMISQYENGVRNPKLETLQKIADALDVLMSDLLTFDVLSSLEKTDVENWVSLIGDTNRDKIDEFMLMLNDSGQKEAVRQVELLTKIPEYRKDDQPPTPDN